MASTSSKKENVRVMFNSIAKRYDFLNHFLSLGIDKLWRKKLVKLLIINNPQIILDVATGTGDLAIEVSLKSKANIIGIDIAEEMIEIGKNKIKAKKLEHQIKLQVADSENIPFETAIFDAAMVSFGVRNFETLEKGLSEMHRVLKSGAMIAVLEFSKPKKFPVKNLYMFYFRHILPTLGRIISGDKAAYTYLPESVRQFPDGQQFIEILNKIGFKETTEKRLSFGIASIYTGIKI